VSQPAHSAAEFAANAAQFYDNDSAPLYDCSTATASPQTAASAGTIHERSGVMAKIGVIGAGVVGSAALLSMVARGSAREIVVLNRGRKRASAVATDLRYGAALSPVVDIHDGDYPDLAGASLVMIAAGVNEKAGRATDRKDAAGRLRLLDMNVGIYRDILPSSSGPPLKRSSSSSPIRRTRSLISSAPADSRAS